jgi:hypothetical protein
MMNHLQKKMIFLNKKNQFNPLLKNLANSLKD